MTRGVSFFSFFIFIFIYENYRKCGILLSQSVNLSMFTRLRSSVISYSSAFFVYIRISCIFFLFFLNRCKSWASKDKKKNWMEKGIKKTKSESRRKIKGKPENMVPMLILMTMMPMTIFHGVVAMGATTLCVKCYSMPCARICPEMAIILNACKSPFALVSSIFLFISALIRWFFFPPVQI